MSAVWTTISMMFRDDAYVVEVKGRAAWGGRA